MKSRASSKAAVEDAPVIAFRDAAAFETSLDEHGEQPAGVWLRIAKKGTGVQSLNDDEAVDVGLCYGWISGQRRSLDDVHYLQKYVPRRPGSRWSQVNVAKVKALTAARRCARAAWPRSRPPGPTGAGPPPTSRSATPPSPAIWVPP